MKFLQSFGILMLVVLGLVGVSFYWSMEDSFRKTATLYQTWEQDLAESLAIQKSDAILVKVNQQAKILAPTIQYLELQTSLDSQASKTGSAAVVNSNPFLRQELPITYNAIPLGKMFAYHSVFSIAFKALLSPVFLFSLMVAMLMGSIYLNKQKRMQMEAQQLRAEAEYQSKIAMLARQVAHDIRSPLSALTAIASQMSQANDDRARMIKLVAERVESIAKELLRKSSTLEKSGPGTQHSAAGEGSQKLAPSNDQIFQLSKSAISDLIAEFEVRYSDVAIIPKINIFDFPASEEFQTNLLRTLSNLLQNSLDAFEGSLTVSKRIFIEIQQKHESLEISISDNGKGIPLAIQPNLFQQNFTTGKQNGNGLGLYSAKEFIESTGGDIVLQSAEGMGTTIEISIPSAC